jgi:GTPase involved in cell partitioning and DNA repair
MLKDRDIFFVDIVNVKDEENEYKDIIEELEIYHKKLKKARKKFIDNITFK